MKNIVVLGGSYGGAHAATTLAKDLPDDWRVIVIDRNSHVNHLYVVPRLAVLPGHDHKAFIPYTTLFGSSPTRHQVLHATVTRLSSNTVTLSRSFPEHGLSNVIEFEYCVYALGSILPAPIDLWGESQEAREASVDVLGDIDGVGETARKRKLGTKQEGMEWMQRSQQKIKDVASVLVVGGGALGIQFASDIKNVYPEKEVTLVHSRARLLPRFDPSMHSEIVESLEDLGVKVLLSTRLDLSSLTSKNHVVRTTTGQLLSADMLLLCTGQTPNTALLKQLAPETIDSESKLAHVARSLQLAPIPAEEQEQQEDAEEVDSSLSTLLASLGLSPETTEEPEPLSIQTPYPHIFVIGDAADAFGAIKAGHNAYFQGEVAARNILRLINNEDALEEYVPGEPAIKVSLGLRKSVYQLNGIIGKKEDGADDLDAGLIWPYFGADPQAEGGMMR